MEDLAVLTALNHSGSFGKNFVNFQKKKGVISALSTALTRELSSLTLED